MKINTLFSKISIILLVSMLVLGISTELLADQEKVEKTLEEKKASEVAVEKDATEPKKDAAYWYDRGILCSVYGNDIAAIKYFEKVIKLEPERSKAYFHRGVSYGEIDEFEKGLSSICKAIELDPQMGLYYYGRGRVYLMLGDKEKAIEDFKQAAILGDYDARNYLKNVVMVEWE